MSKLAQRSARPLFRPSVPEFRRAFCMLAQGADAKVWECDVEQLLELAFGPGLRFETSWRALKAECEGADGMLPAAAVLDFIDSGELQRALLLLGYTAAARGEGAAQAAEHASFSSICDLVETFVQFDCDANGVICAKDLKKALTSLTGDTPSVQDCKAMIQRVDANRDGVVDLAEFCTMMSGCGLMARAR